MELTHTDSRGKANMVDVGEKAVTVRTARAQGKIVMQPGTLLLIKDNALKKGDVLSCAAIAGIGGAKRTSELIPLCHNIPIEKVEVTFGFEGEDTLVINSYAKCEYKTGIEMEALCAVSVAALCVYDMCKAVDRGMRIVDIQLVEKTK